MPSPFEDEPMHPDCPAGNHLCPHLPEVIKLREEVRDLSALVRTDELTGLFNFRFFNQAVELEMERTRRSGQPTVLIMLDLDHFKDVNDAYGHEVGNHALTYVAKIIRNTIRRLDIACRYGGEEFALILPDTDLSPGVLFADRLRLIMESARIDVHGIDIKLTASLGVAVFQKGEEMSPREFIDKVDAYLYEAKLAGRNRVNHSTLED